MTRLLITAGPTREPIDSVRFISNRSSGRMGVALATAGAAAGFEVTLLLGPTPLDPPAGVHVVPFETGDDLRHLLAHHRHHYDILIMAAAVCDYRPQTRHAGKRHSTKGESWQLALEATDDLVAALAVARASHQHVVAFALENREHLDIRAHEKLKRKQVDAIVANPLPTMDAKTIEPIWLGADGERDAPGTMTKAEAAQWIVGKLERWDEKKKK